jgi:CheY-like chemotaxis protein
MSSKMHAAANDSDGGHTRAGGTATAPVVSAPPRVLIVKDHDGTSRAYAGVLRAKGLSIEMLPHGAEVFAAVSARRHDLIILEQSRFPEQGWTLLHVIREYLGVHDLPIVVVGCTTTGDPSTEQRWREYGVARVFEKRGVSGAAIARTCRTLLSLASADGRTCQPGKQMTASVRAPGVARTGEAPTEAFQPYVVRPHTLNPSKVLSTCRAH